MMLRGIYLFLLAVLPSRLKIELLRLQGHTVSRKAHIGLAWLDIRGLYLAEGARISSFNVFKGINHLVMGRNAGIGRFNQFTANRHYAEIAGSSHGIVELADAAVITMRHYFDCQSRIYIGEHSLVAGIQSVFFTHQKGIRGLHEAKAIIIGPRVYIGTSCVVLPGTLVAGHAFIGGGSVLSGALEREFALYSSSRATMMKPLEADCAYFSDTDPTARF